MIQTEQNIQEEIIMTPTADNDDDNAVADDYINEDANDDTAIKIILRIVQVIVILIITIANNNCNDILGMKKLGRRTEIGSNQQAAVIKTMLLIKIRQKPHLTVKFFHFSPSLFRFYHRLIYGAKFSIFRTLFKKWSYHR